MLNSRGFIRSLLLASTFSFVVPIALIGGALLGLGAVAQVPLLAAIAQGSAGKLLEFLAVFGSGNALHGTLVIALTCGSVGALFDTYAFYQYQRGG